MEGEGDGDSSRGDDERPALTPQVLDYYKRFGRHRDLEQYFSLTTVQGDAREPVFWRSLKSQPDSESSKSSAEVCRISINCTMAETFSSPEASSRGQDQPSTSDNAEPSSPPIVCDEVAPTLTPVIEEDGGIKSDLDVSHKSMDLNLDSSVNKPHSPTSSINSQRKLEWDSLADVGYANENDRKPSASSLSTLERLALHQQFSLSDEIKNDEISGRPTAHSTPHEEENNKLKAKKSLKKTLLKNTTTKVSQRDVDVMEVNVDRGDKNAVPPNINLHLTKHISFNVDPATGSATVSSTKTSEITDDGKEVTVDAAVGTSEALDKEIQTTLPRHDSEKKHVTNLELTPNMYRGCIATLPVLLNMDMLKQSRHRGLNYYRNKVINKKKKRSLKQQQKLRKEKKVNEDLEKSIPISEVTAGGGQVSEADSFEYMPAHVYQQNTARNNPNNRESNTETSNKTSSLESSYGHTTRSSQHSDNSFTKDLETSIALLNKLVQQRHQDGGLKQKLVKEVVQKLIRTNYRDDESATEFLSGLSFSSKFLHLGTEKSRYNTTTSTSDGNSGEFAKHSRPRKSILRSPKSAKPTEQSGQKDHNVGETSAQIHSPRCTTKKHSITTNVSSSSNKESTENVLKSKTFSDEDIPKTSSEKLYQLYLKALMKENKYKEQLKNKDKEVLRQKICQKERDTEISEKLKSSSLKDLLKDLIKCDLPNAGGDSALRADTVHSNPETERSISEKKLRNHSVFTISSVNPACQLHVPSDSKKQVHKNEEIKLDRIKSKNETNRCHINIDRSTLPKTSKNLHYCCCPYHSTQDDRTNPAVQVNNAPSTSRNKSFSSDASKSTDKTFGAREHIQNRVTAAKSVDLLPTDLLVSDKFVCFCNADGKIIEDIPDKFLIYKCCKLPHPVKFDAKCKIQSGVCISTQNSNENYNPQAREQIAANTKHATNVECKCNLDQINLHSKSDHDDSLLSKVTTKQGAPTKTFHQKAPQLTEPSSSDFRKSMKSRSDKVYSSSSDLSDVRVTSYPQSARISRDIQRGFHERHAEGCGSNLCVDTYMQTSVSIDPKISEPTIADINVLQDSETINNTNELPLKDDIGCVGGPVCRCYRCDANLKLNIDKPILNQPQKRHYGQRDTHIIYDSVVHYEGSSEKSVRSPQVNVDLLSFNQTSVDEDVCFGNTVGVGNNMDKINQKDVETSISGLVKDAMTMNSIKSSKMSSVSGISSTDRKDKAQSHTNGKSERSSHCPYETTMKSAFKGREMSTQVTPRDDCDDNHRKNIKKGYSSTHKSTDDISSSSSVTKEALMASIKDIIKRYAKEDKPVTVDKKKSRQKYYKEIISKLHYLLQTDSSMNEDDIHSIKSLNPDTPSELNLKAPTEGTGKKHVVDKSTQLRNGTSHCKLPQDRAVYTATLPHTRRMFHSEDSSDLPQSSDIPGPSSDSFPCQILKKIKRECEKFHQKQCRCSQYFEKLYSLRNATSSTSVDCAKCERKHHCSCRTSHRKNKNASKSSQGKESKKNIAYNLIIQPSDSVIVDDNIPERDKPALKDIVIKVPSRRSSMFDKTSQNYAKNIANFETGQFLLTKEHLGRKESESEEIRTKTSKADDSDLSGTNEITKIKFLSIREYLERNRPDFVNNTCERQNCLRVIHESRAREQRVRRELLSLQAGWRRDMSGEGAEAGARAAQAAELESLARRLGEQLRTRRPSAKFLNERDMKHHSRRIYKSLPEVQQKKEKHKKEQIKKTNMVISSLFNKNLQKKALSGRVDISNYSPIIKI